MKIQRIIAAEGTSGVAIRIDTIDTARIQYLDNVWGFDRVPGLPLKPEQILGEYQKWGYLARLGAFASILLYPSQRRERGRR